MRFWDQQSAVSYQCSARIGTPSGCTQPDVLDEVLGDLLQVPHLQMAMGSASELEYHLLLARDLKILSTPAYELLDPRVTEVKRMWSSFIQKLTTES